MGNKVTVQAIGGDPVVLDKVCTVKEAKEKVGLPSYTATINGRPASDESPIPDYGFVTLSAPVKGGR